VIGIEMDTEMIDDETDTGIGTENVNVNVSGNGNVTEIKAEIGRERRAVNVNGMTRLEIGTLNGAPDST
jgi:hypothetical protein